jgi:hypothetical protein
MKEQCMRLPENLFSAGGVMTIVVDGVEAVTG